jgi:hypothetical protein
MLEHNPKIRDFFITIDMGIFWGCPMLILKKIFGMEEVAASGIVKKHRKYWYAPVRWIARKTWRKERPCNRQLKYVGCQEENEEDSFFKVGQIYVSKAFNGATYKINGYDRYIGCAYFERLT